MLHFCDAITNKLTSVRLPKSLLVVLWVAIAETLLSWTYALISHCMGRPKPYTWPYYEIFANGGTDKKGDLLGFVPLMQHLGTPAFFAPGAFSVPARLRLSLLALRSRPAAGWHRLRGIDLPYRGSLRHGIDACLETARRFCNHRDCLHSRAGSVLFFVGFRVEPPERRDRYLRPYVCGALFYQRGANTPFAILIGIVTVLKMFPFILLGLLFSRRKYGLVMLALTTTGLLTYVASHFETGSVRASLLGTHLSFQLYYTYFVAWFAPAYGWDHSLFGLVKLCRYWLGHQSAVGRIYPIYMASAAAS